MQVRFYWDSGANIHSGNEDIVDLWEEFEITDEDWQAMSEGAKYLLAEEWAWNNGLEIGWQDV